MRFHIRANRVVFVYLVGMGNVGSEENIWWWVLFFYILVSGHGI